MVDKDDILRERIRGVLYGLLIGDALGCPVEGCLPSEIVEQFGRITQMEEPKNQRYRPKGLHSDDGQQAMALCDAILTNPAAIPEEFASILLALYRAPVPVSQRLSYFFGLHRGHGKNFRATVKALDQGVSVTESGQPSSGNGSAMLIAPLAIYCRDASIDSQQTAVISVAKVKTYDVRGIAAASAVFAMVRHYCVSGNVWNERVQNEVLQFVRQTEMLVGENDPYKHTFSRALQAMFEQQKLPLEEVVAGIGLRASETAEREVSATIGYAPASVITSIYIAVQSVDFRNAVEDVIALGGDTDTTAAMVGAIVGARDGFSAIPVEWYNELCARDSFDDRVEGFLKRQHDWHPRRTLVDLETEWCALYENPVALARIAQEKERRAEERRRKMEAHSQKRAKIVVEGIKIDGRWLMAEYQRDSGPWLGMVLQVLQKESASGNLASLADVRSVIEKMEG